MRGSSLVALAVVASSIGASPVFAEQERLLQNVDVVVGSDGAVTKISSTLLRSVGDANPSADEKSHDPSTKAGELPVRVLTSYRLTDGGTTRAGTDLDDIAGRKGRVVVEVTVQNTTVRPEALTATAAGLTSDGPTLVGVPLTVVGGVDLGDAAFADLVSGGDAGDSGVVTNGVVSRTDRGGRVQWATFLAPPRLPASQTFRLVFDTDDFTPPTLDLSVQPGLLTDSSIDRLIDSVFGPGAGGVEDLQLRTVTLLRRVNETLGEAGGSLQNVQQTLDDARNGLGQQTIANLQSGQTQLQSELAALIDELTLLRDDVSDDFRSSGDKITADIGTTIDGVLAQLGDPDELLAERDRKRARAQASTSPTASPTSSPGTGGADDACKVGAPTIDPAKSVFAQLIAVGDGLIDISDATDACRQAIADRLAATLTAEGPSSVVGRLDERRKSIDGQRAKVLKQSGNLKGLVAGATSAGLVDRVFGMADDLRDLRTSLTVTDDGKTNPSTAKLVKQAKAISSELSKITDDLAKKEGDDTVATVLKKIGTDASQRAAALSRAGGVEDDLDAVAEQVCGLTLTGPDADARDGAVALLVGKDCAGDQADPGDADGSVRERVVAARSTLETIAKQAGGAAPSSATSLVGALTTILDTVIGQLGKFITTLTDPNGAVATLEKTIDELGGAITQGLGRLVGDEKTLDVPTCADLASAGSGTTRALGKTADDLAFAVKRIDCQREKIDGDIDALLGTDSSTDDSTVAGALGGASSGLIADQDGVRTAKDSLVGSVGTLFDRAKTALDSTESSVTCTAGLAIERQRDALGETPAQDDPKDEVCDVAVVDAKHPKKGSARAKATRVIDAGVDEAARRLTAAVAASNRDTAETSRQLVALLQKVLDQIGDPDTAGGTGLLDIIGDQVTVTAGENENLRAANQDAGSFRSVRAASLVSLRKEQQALEIADEQAASYPLFDMTTPAGSIARVVFTLHVGGDR